MVIPNILVPPSKWFSKPNFKLSYSNSKTKETKPKSSSTTSSSSLPNNNPHIKAAFHHIDTNRDGKISCEELQSYFASIGEPMTRDDARRLIEDFDADGDESLEFNDFVKLVKGGESSSSSSSSSSSMDNNEELLRRAFEIFEVEKGCGFITPTGLQKMFNRIGYVKSCEECMGMIGAFDLDGDGVIDFQEFLKMMA